MRKTLVWLTIFTLLAGLAPAFADTGLEWPGNGAVRRMLYWDNPMPMYPATYIWRVLPHQKHVPSDAPNGYYTTLFWGNNGVFAWNNGQANSYYGAHPYPDPAPNGQGKWELAVFSNDFLAASTVQWDRWFTQVLRVWRVNSNTTVHEFYYDWPDTSKVLSYTIQGFPSWGATPPHPSIMMGQAPDSCGPPPCQSGTSWGFYAGWEEFKGVIRGMQFYSAQLSLTDITAEVATPKSSTAGNANIWYLNLDPTPSDATDKKGVGTAHNPLWAGTTATLWTSGPVQASITSLACTPGSIQSGASTTCTATLNQAAPVGGSVVALSSNNTALPVPASVTVAEGATSGNFSATGGTVATSQVATVTGTLNGTATAQVTVNPVNNPNVSSIACNPSPIVAGGVVACTVTLTQAAPAGGSTVTLQSSNPTAFPVPANTVVTAGATTKNFNVTTGSPGASFATVTITATLNVSKTTQVIVNPAGCFQ